jgi:diacylglycerol kinase (ATP)
MKSHHKNRSPFTRLWNALFYSLDGLSAAFRYEGAFRSEVVMALILIPIAVHTDATGVEKAVMIASVLLVLVIELVNSAIESLTDLVSLEDHVLAKRAKDMGSAAVMLALINVPVVWFFVLVA